MAEIFTKNPIDVEAMQFDGSNASELADWVDNNGGDIRNAFGTLFIFTLEGDMMIRPEDWVIKGIKGEFYPCKPDIFNESYTKKET